MITVEQQLRAELSAAHATIASLQRQLELRIESVTVTAVFAEPAVEFSDEPTRPAVRRTPAVIRRDPHSAPTKVLGAQS